MSLPPATRALVAAHAAAGPVHAHGTQLGARPPIVSRAAWGGDLVPPRVLPSFGEVDIAVVHHTESANEYTAEQSAGIVLAITKFHRDTRGWNDVGYNFLVDRFGTIFEGRAGGVDLPVIGAHAQGFNSISTGISIIGSFMAVEPPAPALDAVARLIGWRLPLAGIPVERSGDRHLRRRLAEPLPQRRAGDARSHLRPPRRRQHRLPGRPPLRGPAVTAREDARPRGCARRPAGGHALGGRARALRRERDVRGLRAFARQDAAAERARADREARTRGLVGHDRADDHGRGRRVRRQRRVDPRRPRARHGAAVGVAARERRGRARAQRGRRRRDARRARAS